MSAKTRLLYGLLITTVLTLGGCGGGGSSGGGERSDEEPAPTGGEMEKGVAYSVSANDRLVVISPEPAEIQMRHSLFPEQRTVTLVSGDAELLQ